MKKAELTTQQIVMLIVLILSFAVILTLLFRLSPTEVTNKEICHNSVVLQGKSSGLSVVLDCKTEAICISGGESCEYFNPDRTIKINLNENPEEQIKKILAEEMADCWWMFGGEEKINYVGKVLSNYHCAICSQIKFDKSIQTKIPEISYEELYNYFSLTKKDESKTYLRYLYGVNEVGQLVNLDPNHEINLKQPIITKEKYSIITGMNYNFKLVDKYIHPLIVQTTKEKQLSPCEEFDVSSY